MEENTKKKTQKHVSFSLKDDHEYGKLATPLKMVFLVHLSCGLGLALAYWLAHNVYSIDLINNPPNTLRLIWVLMSAIVIPLYSLFRHDPNKCSYLRAILRGFLALPAGAVINAFGAIVLGAPAILNFSSTVHWSLLMSVLTFVPAASVYGSSWDNWHRIFAHTKPIGARDYMICVPAHGAVIGAWFGAWPMPLDWERPWQEWPICVSYGVMAGYMVGMIASLGITLYHNPLHHLKGE